MQEKSDIGLLIIKKNTWRSIRLKVINNQFETFKF